MNRKEINNGYNFDTLSGNERKPTMNELFRWLFGAFVIAVICSIPLMIGRNIMRDKRPGRLAGDIVAALFMLVLYGCGASYIKVEGNNALPAYAMINEAFMFHAERNGGIENFHNAMQNVIKQPDKHYSILPHWKYMRYHDISAENALLTFSKNRGNKFPLSVEIKRPDAENFSNLIEQNDAKAGNLSCWNNNMRIGIDADHWDRHTRLYFSLGEFLLSLACSACWLFPLAAAAYKAKNKWAFAALHLAVLTLFGVYIYCHLETIPEWNPERCKVSTALAILTKPENQPKLQKLLQHPIALKENALIAAPMLCSGNFFNTRFLCWNLGNANFLYYSPTDLRESKLITSNAQVTRPAENFYLVSYPSFIKVCRNQIIQFIVIQTIAALLWLGMFIMALKHRRHGGEILENTVQ